MAKAAYPTIGIAALVMFGIVYFIGCLLFNLVLLINNAKVRIYLPVNNENSLAEAVF